MKHPDREHVKLIGTTLDRLKEIGQNYGSFGCGILIPQPRVRIPNDAWTVIAEDVRSNIPVVILGAPDPWLDPCPTGLSCLRWWGNQRGVEKFKDWADRAASILRHHEDLFPGVCFRPGYHRVIESLCGMAATMPDLAPLIEERTVFDMASLLPLERTRLPIDFYRANTTLRIVFLDVCDEVLDFTTAILHQLLKDEPGPAKLWIDTETKIAWLDQASYHLEDVQLVFLSFLIEAKGEIRSWTWMLSQDKTGLLKDVSSRTRLKESFPVPIRNLIRSKPGAGYRIDV